MVTTDSTIDKIVEVRCSLTRTTRQRKEKESAAERLPVVDAIELRAKLPRITHTVARAILFEHAIAAGEASDHSDLGRLTGMTRERSQVIRMTWLAPVIQEEILRLPPVSRRRAHAISVREIEDIAEVVMWDDQREAWRKLKEKKGLKDLRNRGNRRFSCQEELRPRCSITYLNHRVSLLFRHATICLGPALPNISRASSGSAFRGR